MIEVEMTPAPAGPGLDCLSLGPMHAHQILKCGIRAVAWIEVQHHKTGDDSGDNGDVSVRPASEPLEDFPRVRMTVLVDLPADQGLLAAALDRDDRPTQTTIIERGLQKDAVV